MIPEGEENSQLTEKLLYRNHVKNLEGQK